MISSAHPPMTIPLTLPSSHNYWWSDNLHYLPQSTHHQRSCLWQYLLLFQSSLTHAPVSCFSSLAPLEIPLKQEHLYTSGHLPYLFWLSGMLFLQICTKLSPTFQIFIQRMFSHFLMIRVKTASSPPPSI